MENVSFVKIQRLARDADPQMTISCIETGTRGLKGIVNRRGIAVMDASIGTNPAEAKSIRIK